MDVLDRVRAGEIDHDTVGPRGFDHRGGGSWEIAATHFHRKFIHAIAHRFGQVKVVRETREGQDRCTTGCADASIDTADLCECVCLGDNHGQGAAGWTHVGERLLVRPGVLALITTIHRR